MIYHGFLFVLGVHNGMGVGYTGLKPEHQHLYGRELPRLMNECIG